MKFKVTYEPTERGSITFDFVFHSEWAATLIAQRLLREYHCPVYVWNEANELVFYDWWHNEYEEE